MSLNWGAGLVVCALCILGLIDLPRVVAFTNSRSDNVSVHSIGVMDAVTKISL
jgi:hypothetical protein